MALTISLPQIQLLAMPEVVHSKQAFISRASDGFNYLPASDTVADHARGCAHRQAFISRASDGFNYLPALDTVAGHARGCAQQAGFY